MTTTQYPGYHPCPGCDRPDITNRQLACKPCWTRLPQALKAAITSTGRHSHAHRFAVAAASRWYRDNQGEAS